MDQSRHRPIFFVGSIEKFFEEKNHEFLQKNPEYSKHRAKVPSLRDRAKHMGHPLPDNFRAAPKKA
jgi:hypothetical protein